MSRKLHLFVLLIVSFFVGADDVCAQGSLEDLLFMDVPVVVGPSKREQNLKEAPSVVSVITAKEIKDFGANSLYDVLNRAPSIQMLGSNCWPQDVASMRGDLDMHIDNRILILLNGRPIRDGIMGGTNFSIYTGFPVDMIERIEIIRGPGSVLYGSNAFVGVINIVTRKVENDLEVSGSVGGGSFSASRDTFNILYDKDDLNVNSGLLYFHERGWKFKAKDLAGTDGTMRFGEESLGCVTDIAYEFNGGETKLGVSNFYTDFSQDSFGIVPSWAQKSAAKGSQAFTDISLVQKTIYDWELHANVTWNYMDYNFVLPTSTNHELASDWIYEGYLSGKILDAVNSIVGFLAEHRERPTGQFNGSLPVYKQQNYSTYAQFDYSPLESLNITCGYQLLDPDAIKPAIVQRFGATYKINNNFSTKILYGEAFRAPAPAEQFIQLSSLVGNPNLKPEEISTVDWQLLYNNQNLSAALTLFRSRYYNVIARTTTTPASYTNSGGYEVEGVELEGKYNVSDKLYFQSSLTYKDEKDNLMLSPDLMVKFGVSYATDFGLNMGLFNSVFCEPRAVSAGVANPRATTVSLMDLNLTYKLPIEQDIEINLYVRNLLDQDYNFVEFNRRVFMTTMPQQSGRAIYGKLSFKF